MRIPYLLLMLIVLLAGGVAGYLKMQSQVVSPEWQGQVETQLNELVAIDSRINEQALKNRYALSVNYDLLAKLPMEFERGINELTTLLQDDSVSNQYLQNPLKNLKKLFVNKNDILENFKSHNSILFNSIRHTPEVGEELLEILEEEGLTTDFAVLQELINKILSYALLGDKENEKQLTTLLSQLGTLTQRVSASAQITVMEFLNHGKTVLHEKDTTDLYLNSLLEVPIFSGVTAVQQKFADHIKARTANQSKQNYFVIAYLALLGLGLVYFSWRLRSLYQELDSKVQERTSEINDAYKSLKKYQGQLVQSEKMASIGQMIAGVAHEINTPLGYISNNMNLVKRDLKKLASVFGGLGTISDELAKTDKDKKVLASNFKNAISKYRQLKKENVVSEVNELLEDSEYGLKEINNLVTNLRDFSRDDIDEIEDFDVNAGVENTLKICKVHVSKMQIIKQFSPIPSIECAPSKINQLFMNIIVNASQATEGKGKLLIATSLDPDGFVNIMFRDNGVGIDSDVINTIFDPFFTTKEIGEGTGLGLSIAYKIAHDHGGDIIVKSVAGESATFTVVLPVKQEGTPIDAAVTDDVVNEKKV